MWLSSNTKPRVKRVSQGPAPGTRKRHLATPTPSMDTGARARAKGSPGKNLEVKVTQVDTGNQKIELQAPVKDPWKLRFVLLFTFTAASVDSGPQESWTALVQRGCQKGSNKQTLGSSCLNQNRTKIHRGLRQEASAEGESSPADSDSSDQGRDCKKTEAFIFSVDLFTFC